MNNWQEIDLSGMLRRGYPDKRLDRLASSNLQDCVNYRVTEFGLQGIDSVLLMSDSGSLPADDLPFPSLCLLEDEQADAIELYAIFQNEIFKLSWNGVDWDVTGTSITTFEDDEVNFTSTIEDIWHTAEFNGRLVATNGIEMITTLSGVFKSHIKMVPNTVCKFRGRLYAGGLAGNDVNEGSEFLNDDYIALLQDIADPYLGTVSVGKLGQNAVYYSNIDPFDFFARYDDTPTEANIFLDKKLNNSGYIIMPWSGKVLCVKPLGEGIVVYGSNGISFLKQNRTPFAMQLTPIQHEGVPSRRSVGGDRFRHVFLGNNGSLWEISADLKLRELGYEETISDIGDIDKILVNYDSTRNDIYLSTTDESRLITQNGMSKLSKSWISLLRAKGLLQGFYKDLDGSIPEDAAVAETGVIRFPSGKPMTTRGLRLITKNPAAHTVTLYHRRSEAESWKNLSSVTPDKGGFCDLPQTNYEKKIRIVTNISVANNTIEGAILYYDSAVRTSIKGLT